MGPPVTLGGALLRAGQLHNAKAHALHLDLCGEFHHDTRTSLKWISLCNIQTKQLDQERRAMDVDGKDDMYTGPAKLLGKKFNVAIQSVQSQVCKICFRNITS